MRILRSIGELRAWRRELGEGASIGFVPTMGALHDGHRSLIAAARRDCRAVAVSIFVNPTQFGPEEDYASYPRDEAGDIRVAESAGADLVWFGRSEEIYPSGFETRVEVPELAAPLCGIFRPHHFAGVAIIVLKLFHLVRPERAYFGEKDYQQLAIVRRMTADLDLDLEIVACPTVREPDGLAMSSRNRRLSPEGRRAAACLYRALAVARARCAEGERSGLRLTALAARTLAAEPQVVVEYVEIVDPRTLRPVATVEAASLLALAARVEGVRLIDNVMLAAARA